MITAAVVVIIFLIVVVTVSISKTPTRRGCFLDFLRRSPLRRHGEGADDIGVEENDQAVNHHPDRRRYAITGQHDKDVAKQRDQGKDTAVNGSIDSRRRCASHRRSGRAGRSRCNIRTESSSSSCLRGRMGALPLFSKAMMANKVGSHDRVKQPHRGKHAAVSHHHNGDDGDLLNHGEFSTPLPGLGQSLATAGCRARDDASERALNGARTKTKKIARLSTREPGVTKPTYGSRPSLR